MIYVSYRLLSVFFPGLVSSCLLSWLSPPVFFPGCLLLSSFLALSPIPGLVSPYSLRILSVFLASSLRPCRAKDSVSSCGYHCFSLRYWHTCCGFSDLYRGKGLSVYLVDRAPPRSCGESVGDSLFCEDFFKIVTVAIMWIVLNCLHHFQE